MNQLKILIIDDNSSDCESLECILKPYGNCDFTADSKMAIDVFSNSLEEKATYDIIFLDINTHGIDWMEMLSEIRRIESEKGIKESNAIKIIVHKPVDDPGDVIKAHDFMFDAYFEKPVKRNKIIEIMRYLGLTEEAGTAIRLKIRCNNCSKVIDTILENDGRNWECPDCKNSFTIPNINKFKARQTGRKIVHESEMSTPLPETLKKPGITPLFRIKYTEASPVNFVLKRNNALPLLDLSENGLGFLCKEEDASLLKTGIIIMVEIDFPILEEPLIIQVEVRWIKQMSNKKLYRVGVEFYQQEKDLQKILNTFFNYITLRPELWK
jgi:two-component system chemotaxis response regulator CheY